MSRIIYALKANNEWCDVLPSLQRGEGRFGWSYISNGDLYQLKQRIEQNGWDNLSHDEQNCYQNFLLDFKEGDYVIYINAPEWGKCTVAKVSRPYYWRYEDPDFNHRFGVDASTVYVFDRNDRIVHPALRSRLKLQRRWWRIYLDKEFGDLLSSLQYGIQPTTRTPADNLRFLSNEIQPLLLSITQQIQHTHPNYDLEILFGEVFKKVPGVIDVRCQGGAGDKGADILVTFEDGLPIPGLQNEYIVVVQIKSFQGDHWDTRAVEDIERAFDHYPEASMGLIISTANASTTQFDNALDMLREKSKKPVALLIGPDVASFVLRFGAKLLV